MSDDDSDRLVQLASEGTKRLSEVQTLVQGFADNFLSVKSLDTERDATAWMKAATTFAAEASMIWLKGAMLFTRQSARFVEAVVQEVQERRPASPEGEDLGSRPARVRAHLNVEL